MARFFIYLLCCALATVCLTANPPKAKEKQPDLEVENISLHKNGFVHITLKNKSPVKIPVPPTIKEKIFLVIYIDNLKRAEYKLKYINPKLFLPNGLLRFRTNFRVPPGIKMKMKAEINKAKIIKELNYRNNRLEKVLQIKPKK